MAVGLPKLPRLLPVDGIRLGTASAGIKKPGRPDLTVMEIAAGSNAAGVFTRNAFCAAPVIVAREHLEAGQPRYLLINTGNANAGTGDRGLADARRLCAALAESADCCAEAVVPFSTGVIGEHLPVERMEKALPEALETLDTDGWVAAAAAILTTDTGPKGACRRLAIDGHQVTVTGIAKGAGMIRPDMATMLAFVATDAPVEPGPLQYLLTEAVRRSFNRITVDGDTSTNDACMLIATGKAGTGPIGPGHEGYAALSEAVSGVCEELAQAIVRDGEGATRFVTIETAGGASEQECERVAYTIAHSPLVKTAIFAGDPNWGRILAAVGRSGIADMDLSRVAIWLDDVCIVRDGGRAPDYTEERGQAVMSRDEITIRVELGRGEHAVRVWTCDLSYEYVRINAEYRT